MQSSRGRGAFRGRGGGGGRGRSVGGSSQPPNTNSHTMHISPTPIIPTPLPTVSKSNVGGEPQVMVVPSKCMSVCPVCWSDADPCCCTLNMISASSFFPIITCAQ